MFCVSELADQGAGHPDFGLFTAGQVQGGRPREGQVPERGVVEVKSVSDDAWLTAEGDQVSRYWERYRLVLVTNTRDFVLVSEDREGQPARLEAFSLAGSAGEFESRLETPRAFAGEVGAGLGEYLCRALSHRASISDPGDLAWLLASYARDGLARVEVAEAAGGAPSLTTVRSALEEGLGVRFEGVRGGAFFRSALVQTLFYGVFSAWVLWARQTPPPTGSFSWREAVWYLRVPVLRALFQQLSNPGQLRPLGLVEVLDWTAAALDRVDRETFLARFGEGEAVPTSMSRSWRRSTPLCVNSSASGTHPQRSSATWSPASTGPSKTTSDVADGLAGENVYVLDPCCGTGAYLAEVLRRIAGNLQDQGLGALTGSQVKQAAMERVFGFEIMPAPFVVAHLQVGLTLQDLDAPMAEGDTERAQVFLTNALTGWEPEEQKPLPIPELEQERDPRRPRQTGHADPRHSRQPALQRLRRNGGRRGATAIGGLPGNETSAEAGGAGPERPVRPVLPDGPSGGSLEKTGQGVVCFISNYSWLDGLSHTGMRERYLEAFNPIRVDNLNGDKYKTGKTTPDGDPDPSIFSTPEDPVGIQVGTAITTLVRKPGHTPTRKIELRQLWGQDKREQLAATAETDPDVLYQNIEPTLLLGLPFTQTTVSDDWFDWPSLPDLFPASFPGVKTNRDPFLVDIDLDRLKARIADYFNPDLGHDEITRSYPVAMRDTSVDKARCPLCP